MKNKGRGILIIFIFLILFLFLPNGVVFAQNENPTIYPYGGIPDSNRFTE